MPELPREGSLDGFEEGLVRVAARGAPGPFVPDNRPS
jgi:hypothetical protein